MRIIPTWSKFQVCELQHHGPESPFVVFTPIRSQLYPFFNLHSPFSIPMNPLYPHYRYRFSIISPKGHESNSIISPIESPTHGLSASRLTAGNVSSRPTAATEGFAWQGHALFASSETCDWAVNEPFANWNISGMAG